MPNVRHDLPKFKQRTITLYPLNKRKPNILSSLKHVRFFPLSNLYPYYLLFIRCTQILVYLIYVILWCMFSCYVYNPLNGSLIFFKHICYFCYGIAFGKLFTYLLNDSTCRPFLFFCILCFYFSAFSMCRVNSSKRLP